MATCNPVSIYAMKEKANVLHCVDLYEIFPRTISGVWQPLITIAPLGGPLEGQVILHEEEVRFDEFSTSTEILLVCIGVFRVVVLILCCISTLDLLEF